MKDLKLIAQQLRKPSGDFATAIAEKMNEGNNPLYDLTFNTMGLEDNDTILEIGFGNGFHFEKLLSLKNNLSVYGIDYSGEMVSEAKAGNRKEIESGRLNLTEGSSDNLPFEDQKFEAVFCNMVIYFWDEPEKHLSEIHRVLKPSGKFYTGMRTRESMLQFPFTKYDFNLFTVIEWEKILNRNGFTVSGSVRNTDPALEEDDKKINLESVCIIAEKTTS